LAELARRPFIAGNWKMNFDHLQAIAFVQKLAWSLQDARHDFDAVEVAVFPPFTDLRSVQTLINGDKLPLAHGAQDVSQYAQGAYTGEIAAEFLTRLDCAYVIIGHSERRTLFGDTDEIVAAKTAAATAAGLVPVICVGETAEDLETHGPAAVPVAQLEAVLGSVAEGAEIVVAYEPVWAIGSGKPATPEQAQQVTSALRAAIAAKLGEATAATTRILYGGSVKPDVIAGYMRQKDVDGALVGGASLDVDSFAGIVRYQKHVGV
jgi:triosephosphate isomerase